MLLTLFNFFSLHIFVEKDKDLPSKYHMFLRREIAVILE